MLNQSPIKLKPLAALCHRVGISLETGIDIRRVWENESERGSTSQRHQSQLIAQAIAAGESMSAAFQKTGKFFPELIHEMVAVGEQTGKLDQVFLRLADHYQHLLSLKRDFLKVIAWPVIQLVSAIGVISLFIYVLGMIGREPIDVLGFGLTGGRGVIKFLGTVGIISWCVYFMVRAISLQAPWTLPLQYYLFQLPSIGAALQTLVLSRMAWSLALTTNTGMSIQQALQLAQQSTRTPYFTQHIAAVDAALQRGEPVHEALRHTGVYPDDYLEAMQVGEETGRTSETMAILSRQYEERAKSAMTVITALIGYAVWCLVAVMLIVMIFKIFTAAYLNPINNLLDEIGG